MPAERWQTVYGVSAEQVATLTAGYDDGSFRPAEPVTRGQFAKMAVEGFGLPMTDTAGPTFSDVPAGSTFYPFIERAAAAKVLSGYEDGTFRPSLPLTRQQAGSIVGALLENAVLRRAGAIAGSSGLYSSLEEWYGAEGAELLRAYADGSRVAPVHAPAMSYLVFRGIMQGNSRSGGTFLDLGAEVTRAQAVVLLLRAKAHLPVATRSIDPFVSSSWLAANLERPGLVVLDLRSASDYAAGHIAKAVSVPFGPNSAWAKSSDLTMERPSDEDLAALIGASGITADSSVVLVGGRAATAPTYPLVDTTRVAATLIDAGLRDVAILQGGHAAWVEAGLPTSTEPFNEEPVAYILPAGGSVFVSTEYVEESVGTAVIADTRSPEVYFGIATDAAGKPGHLPTAKCLPAQWLWQTGGTYVSAQLAGEIASGVVGSTREREIIVYCTVGGTASAWWYMLTQVLGYTNVKIYDGSAQAWAKDNELVAFAWSS